MPYPNVPANTEPPTELQDHVVSTIGALLSQYAPCPRDLTVAVVITEDFAAAVEDAWRISGVDFGLFDSTRPGGTVHGKSISLNDDRTEWRTIIDSHWWCADTTSAERRISLLAHELFHPRLERLRIEAGSVEHLAGKVDTPAKGARWSVRNALDEFRCDLAANSVLGALFTVETDQGRRPLPIGLLGLKDGTSYLGAVADVFDEILPEWKHVLSARQSVDPARTSLIARKTGGLLTALGHAEAEARSLGMPGVFAIPELADHALAALLRVPWVQICEAYDHHQGWDDIHLKDSAIADVGQQALLNLWQNLRIL
ncbi:hypothetical protein [Micromonospora globbae]|nr:hypothetical protein [Micromonospora globbae]